MSPAARPDLARLFGQVLRGLRLQVGLSQEELAHQADVSRNYIGLLEQGRRSPALGVIFALAEALSDSPSALIAAVEGEASRPVSELKVLTATQRRAAQRYLPVYSLEAAAGLFLDNRPVEEEGWVPLPEGMRGRDGMFVARVRGRSMLPLIDDGAHAIFRFGAAGDREGRVLLVQLQRAEDPEGGGAFTVKRWHSEKAPAPESEGGWRHTRIELRSVNREFRPIAVTRDQDVRVIAEFVRVL